MCVLLFSQPLNIIDYQNIRSLQEGRLFLEINLSGRSSPPSVFESLPELCLFDTRSADYDVTSLRLRCIGMSDNVVETSDVGRSASEIGFRQTLLHVEVDQRSRWEEWNNRSFSQRHSMR